MEGTSVKKASFKPLFAIDIALIAISSVIAFAFLKGMIDTRPDLWNIDRDWSVSETFNYIKWLVLAVVFFLAYLRDRQFLLVVMSVCALFLLADDSLQLHERLGSDVVRSTGMRDEFGRRAYTFGSIAVWIGLGILILAIVYRGWRTASPSLKISLFPVFGYFFAIVFCAVGIDTLHELLELPKIYKGIIGIFEDGGEMIFLTAMLRYVWNTFRA